MRQDPQDVVLEFCASWERRELRDVLAVMGEEIVYQNVPAPVMNGIGAARAFIEPILSSAMKIEFELHHIAATANREHVLTERTDWLHFPQGVVKIPVMGTFRVCTGKIVEWRDYADSKFVGEQFARLPPAH